MLNEEQADDVMSDIHYMTQQGWTNMLDHLTTLHKLRDERVYNAVWDGLIERYDWEVKHPLVSQLLQM